MISEVKNINKGNIIIIHPPVFVEKRCVGANRSLITKKYCQITNQNITKTIDLSFHHATNNNIISKFIDVIWPNNKTKNE